MFHLKTIRQGERVAIWDKQGWVRYVDGPRRLLLWNKKIQPLKRYSAHADQFLAIQFTDGHGEHLLGPSAVWFDPVEHQAIDVKEALHLDSNEVPLTRSVLPYWIGQKTLVRLGPSRGGFLAQMQHSKSHEYPPTEF